MAKESYSRQYNRHHGARPLAPLLPGDVVKIKTDDKNWSNQGVVTGQANTHRSYKVNTPSGTYRRNRRHLQQTGATSDILQPQHNHSDFHEQPVLVPDSTESVNPMLSPARSSVPDVPIHSSPVLRRSSRHTTKPSRLIEQS
jgi:hypothetical protein